MIRRRFHSAMNGMAISMVGAALLVAFGATVIAAQEVELRWKFEPGTERVYRMVQTTRSSGAMSELTQTQTSKLRQQVVAVAEDGAADVRMTYESMRLVQDGPMGHQEFDSERAVSRRATQWR